MDVGDDNNLHPLPCEEPVSSSTSKLAGPSFGEVFVRAADLPTIRQGAASAHPLRMDNRRFRRIPSPTHLAQSSLQAPRLRRKLNTFEIPGSCMVIPKIMSATCIILLEWITAGNRIMFATGNGAEHVHNKIPHFHILM